jgi:hypothetical protein
MQKYCFGPLAWGIPRGLVMGFLCTWCTTVSFCQDPKIADATKVIPPSPTAAGLGNYGNYDVSLYTGSVNISVPLYSYSTNDHDINLALQYDASGIRAGQEASWVGLGWSLLAGGVITRTIRGLDDFGDNGYHYADPIPTALTAQNYQYFSEISYGRLDGEADLFNYNFQGHSGRFVIAKQQPDGKMLVYQDKQNNLLFECLEEGNRWIVTDARGYKYHFTTKEMVRDDYAYSGSIPFDTNSPLAAYQYNATGPGAITSAWYLNTIISPNQERVDFFYDQKSSSLSVPQYSEKGYTLYKFEGQCTYSGANMPGVKFEYNASRQVVLDQYLSAIRFKGGTINFTTTDRTDVDYVEDVPGQRPQKLSEITVVRDDGTTLKRFLFDYDYFLDYSQGRLRLDNVLEFSGNGSTAKPPYVFTYHSNQLPPKFTRLIDHWGYYNGKQSDWMMPYKYIEEDGIEPIFVPGADRTADTTAVRYKAGVLKSIEYPTAGRTEFDFAQHEYGNVSGDDRIDLVPRGFNLESTPAHPYEDNRITFTLTAKFTNVDFSFGYQKYIPDLPDLLNENLEHHYVEILLNGHPLTSYSNWNCPTSTDHSCGSTSHTTSVLLPAGEYEFIVQNLAGYRTYLNASYLERNEVDKRKGGGLRIKTITNYDEEGKEVGYKRYAYNIGDAPSGKLLYKNIYYYTAEISQPTGSACLDYLGYYLVRSSTNTTLAGLATPGAVIGYDMVTETRGHHGEGGSTIYTYRNYPAPVPEKPFVPMSASALNGNANHVAMKNKDGADVSIKESDHVTPVSINATMSVKVHRESLGDGTNIAITHYWDVSSWVTLRYEKEIQVDGPKQQVKYKRYYYDNPTHKQVTRLHEQGHGEVLRTKFKFPGDYPAVAGAFPQELVKKNMVETIIEQQQLVSRDDGVRLVGGVYNEYGIVSGQLKPSRLYQLTASVTDTAMTSLSGATMTVPAAYTEALQFLEYTPQGQVASWKKSNDLKVSYLWDFEGRYPVAEVRNAASTDVAYCSFEWDGKGNWEFSGPVDAVTANIPHGVKCYTLTPAKPLEKGSLTTNGVYRVTYLSNSGAYSITGATETVPVSVGEDVRGWRYYSHTIQVTGTRAGISGTGKIDEARLFPVGAEMTSYNYSPLVGMTERTDTNGEVQHFEYDALLRLRFTKDTRGHVLNRYYYHYLKNPLLN